MGKVMRASIIHHEDITYPFEVSMDKIKVVHIRQGICDVHQLIKSARGL